MSITPKKVYEKVRERSGGLCELCKQGPDWRGLAIHHKRNRGMGGSKHLYTAEELILVCGKCHSQAHHLREV